MRSKQNHDMPHKSEDQHILEIELRRRLEKLEAEQKALAEEKKKSQKELHWMHCPKCGNNLSTQLYGRVEIDVCPSCRGLWLDANELETILANESGLLKSALKILGKR
jgi:rubrerythrin